MSSVNDIQSTRRYRSKIQQRTKRAFLGDENGRIEVPNRTGYVYVRYPNGVDESGFQRYSAPVIVRSAVGASYTTRYNASVRIGKDLEGFDAVLGGDFQRMVEQGVNPTITNALRPELRFINNDNYTPLMSQPVSTGNTAYLKVTVYSWFYDKDNGDLGYFEGTDDDASKLSLASFVPTAGNHKYVIVWLDTYTGLLSATGSTAQATTSALDSTDLQECFATRPADSVPIKGYYLADAQTTLRQNVLHVDLRTLINTPRLLGDETTINHNVRVHPSRRWIVGNTTIGALGHIENLGSIRVI